MTDQGLNEMQDILKKEIEYRKTAQTDAQAKALELHSTLELIPQIAFTRKKRWPTIDFVNQRWSSILLPTMNFQKTHPDDADITRKINMWSIYCLIQCPFPIHLTIV